MPICFLLFKLNLSHIDNFVHCFEEKPDFEENVQREECVTPQDKLENKQPVECVNTPECINKDIKYRKKSKIKNYGQGVGDQSIQNCQKFKHILEQNKKKNKASEKNVLDSLDVSSRWVWRGNGLGL